MKIGSLSSASSLCASGWISSAPRDLFVPKCCSWLLSNSPTPVYPTTPLPVFQMNTSLHHHHNTWFIHLCNYTVCYSLQSYSPKVTLLLNLAVSTVKNYIERKICLFIWWIGFLSLLTSCFLLIMPQMVQWVVESSMLFHFFWWVEGTVYKL